MTGPDPRRWQALALVCVAFFMTVLDVSIVNVALPSIKTSLGFSDTSLQWILVAYAITFGGFLLLGGRLPTCSGGGASSWSGSCSSRPRRSSAGSRLDRRPDRRAHCRASAPRSSRRRRSRSSRRPSTRGPSGTWRSVSGARWAAAAPRPASSSAASSRSTPAGSGSSSSTSRSARRARAHAQRRAREPRARAARTSTPRGAVTVTSGLALLVYAISKAPDVGWAAGRTIGLLVGAAVLLAAFVAIEARQRVAARPVQHLPDEDARRRERRRLPARRRRVRELLRADALRAAGARLLGAQDGPHVPRHGGHGHPGRRRVAGARDAHRRPPGDDRRARADHRRDALVRADPGARAASPATCCPAT